MFSVECSLVASCALDLGFQHSDLGQIEFGFKFLRQLVTPGLQSRGTFFRHPQPVVGGSGISLKSGFPQIREPKRELRRSETRLSGFQTLLDMTIEARNFRGFFPAEIVARV